MNRIYTRQSITIAVVITFVLVSFFAWYSYVNMKRARYETLQVNKTLQSLKVLENLMDDVQDIETANRGFLISAGNLQSFYRYYRHIKSGWNNRKPEGFFKVPRPTYKQKTENCGSDRSVSVKK